MQSLLLFLLPWLLPRLLTWYQRPRPRHGPSQPIPLPPTTTPALHILLLSSLLSLLSTLPLFSPENIFRLTTSRLTTPAGVLLTRLAALRPLTESDATLRSALEAGGLTARLAYALWGPAALLANPLAPPGSSDAAGAAGARAQLLYALPRVLGPHVAHLVAVGAATSGRLGGKAAPRWRTVGVVAALGLAAAEVWYLGGYDSTANGRTTRAGEVEWVFWRVRVWRGLAIAAVDAGLGWGIWASATGRAFVAPAREAGERLQGVGQRLESLLMRVRGVGILRNATAREEGLRAKVEGYWAKEGEVMRAVMEEPEVLEAQRAVLRRMDLAAVGREAEELVESALSRVQVPP